MPASGISSGSMAQEDPEASFSSLFRWGVEQEFPVGPDEGNRAYFGRDVLRGLVDGVDDFVTARQPRWRRFRAQPALLGTVPWIDDEDVLTRLGRLPSCIVITKQTRGKSLDRLHEVNAESPGIPVDALSGLGGMAPKEDGKPQIIGPWSSIEAGDVEAIRMVGYRKHKKMVPIPHAKLMLLGHLWWSDEGPLGHVEDATGFRPLRLWVSSANLTGASRSNLEFGYWTEDPALVKGATIFLEQLIGGSEALGLGSDNPDPSLAPITFDDAAFAGYFADLDSGEDEEDE
jgi:hypothetical protein